MKRGIIPIIMVVFLLFACQNEQNEQNEQKATEKQQGKPEQNRISKKSEEIRDYVKKDVVIAHRGSTYWTPEETEPAFLWARNIGADYLEFDVQKTKDNQLIAFHDKTLKRTTNVADVFPDKVNEEIDRFTLKELRQLDAGSWFNKKNPDRARKSYEALKILTLRDIIKIAEGYRIAHKNGQPVKEIINGEWTGYYLYEKDPNDNGNRPGLYIETKNPKPGVEKLLAEELTRYGWNINRNLKQIPTQQGKVDIANTNGRLVLQTFSKESVKELEKELPNVPKCLLLWQPNMKDNLKENYQKAIEFSIKNNVQLIGSSIAGPPNNYGELTAPWMVKMVKDAGLYMHPYTFDTEEQFRTYRDRVEGVFTNRSDIALEFYGRKPKDEPQEILINLGYK